MAHMADMRRSSIKSQNTIKIALKSNIMWLAKQMAMGVFDNELGIAVIIKNEGLQKIIESSKRNLRFPFKKNG